MSLDQRTRSASDELLAASTPDTARLLGELRRSHRRRRGASVVLGAAALVAAAVGIGLATDDDAGAPQPAGPPWVGNGALVVERVADGRTADLEVLDGGLAHLPADARSGGAIDFDSEGAIVYADLRDAIRRLDPQTGATTVLGRCPEGVLCWPALSPDGTTLAFGGEDGLRLLDVAGGGSREIALPGVGYANAPAWSPDGTTLAVDTASGLWVVPLDGAEPRLLDRHGRGGGEAGPIVVPTWAPDSGEVAWLQRHAAGRSTRFVARVAAADGSGARTLGEAGTCVCLGKPGPEIEWSPDGTTIAVATTAGVPTGSGIHLVPPAGGEWRLLHGGTFSTLAWQPVSQ